MTPPDVVIHPGQRRTTLDGESLAQASATPGSAISSCRSSYQPCGPFGGHPHDHRNRAAPRSRRIDPQFCRILPWC
jgi:hypothetical protein